MTGNAKTGGARDGWRKGEGHYSKSHPKIDRATDYTARGIQAASFGEPMTQGDRAKLGAGGKMWAPAPVKQGSSPPRYHPKGNAGTSPGIRAASPSGKYGKPGGRGQRSGA